MANVGEVVEQTAREGRSAEAEDLKQKAMMATTPEIVRLMAHTPNMARMTLYGQADTDRVFEIEVEAVETELGRAYLWSLIACDNEEEWLGPVAYETPWQAWSEAVAKMYAEERTG